ncbi:FAD-dependent monooxygenase [Plantibacter sp. VKM Ac-2880]|uniref:FAD-dependent monooxygenase n=1 Tax=Plantibacter sp. VKM Ac-2880 TaxID=2783827 RepID=UPI00188E5A88|nr:FAD-dependent monooxygenase [Plantibacter sp. VKM Ac-2880]MBF4567902.1 FAD-dependent monooxygenase [Plantibacter sp. VKM Ac-2880]
MTVPRVLISGASIAGPSLAFWLNRYGWDTTVIERAPAFRDGGQNIDVRGAAREVLRRARLEDAAKEATTGERGTRFVGDAGETIAEFPVSESSETDGATAEVEILRGDLARIFVDATEGATTYRYGDHITGLDDDGERVRVSFAHGDEEDFDLVVAADGVRSSTREVAFPGEAVIRSLGLEMTYLTIPRDDADVPWWQWYSGIGGRSVTLRPDRHGTTRAVLTEVTSDRGDGVMPARRDLEAQRRHLRNRFAGLPWQANRVLDALDHADDVYYESIGQVRTPRWASGRVALLGDAAWCASPVSGMGTSLSIVGAYVLAGELAAHVHHRDAFRGYERIMRPYVEQAQTLPPGTPQLANPTSKAGVTAFRTALRVAGSKPAKFVGAQLFSPPADTIGLPEYEHLEPLRDRA